MAKKFLVTGGGGYIGRHLVRALLRDKHEVMVVSHGNKSVKGATMLDVDIFDGHPDIFDRTGRPDVVVHLAWRDGFKHSSAAHIEDLHKHYVFMRDMLAGGLKHLVGMGSVHEVGYHEGMVTSTTSTRPLSNYGIAKNALRELSELLANEVGATYQWIRAYYITGDDKRNQSVFCKLLTAHENGETSFPFVTGDSEYDFIDVGELAEQIMAVANQTVHTGIINCCSGKPESLASRVERFIADNDLGIKLQYGAFPKRKYDSPSTWGDDTIIKDIMKKRTQS